MNRDRDSTETIIKSDQHFVIQYNQHFCNTLKSAFRSTTTFFAAFIPNEFTSRQTDATGKFIYWCLPLISVLFHWLLRSFFFLQIDFFTLIYWTVLLNFMLLYDRDFISLGNPFNLYFYNNNMSDNFNSREKGES